MDDEKVKNSISESDRSTLENSIKNTSSWLESNESATIEEFEEKQKQLESIANPIISRIYQNGSADTNTNNSADSSASAGPKVEEVD